MADISVATFSLTEGDNGSQVSIIFSDGSSETITDKHSNFDSIVQALISKPEGYGPIVRDLANIAKTVSRKFKNLSSRVTTDGSELYFDGDAIDGSLAQFILKLLREDAQKAAAFFGGENADAGDEDSQVTWEALVKFLELLYSNPNPKSRESLYSFISNYGLTIRKDGYFIAYKGLNSDFGSVNKGYGIVDGVEMNGSLPNKPGSVLRFPRQDVNSNTSIGCAQGLHAGTHAYASDWARGGKLVAVAINPMNVVSVPDDCTFQKIRVCEYEILNEVDPLETAVATSGWDSTSLWDDNYDGRSYDKAIDELSLNDVVSFDYVALDGKKQHIDSAEVDSVEFDQLKAFVPEKDGYRSFKFTGISNLVVEGDDEDSSDSAPLQDEETADEDAPAAQSGTEFLDGLRDKLLNGGGVDFTEVLKSAQSFIPESVREKAKKIVDGSGLDEALGFFEGLLGDEADAPADEPVADANAIAYGDVVSFDYVGKEGSSQAVVGARVEDVKAEYFTAFVPAKDGYRTYKFDGISNLRATEAAKEQESKTSAADVRAIFDTLKISDRISVELDKDGERIKLDRATVLLSNGVSVTVRLANGGYKAFTADDVVKISKV